MGTQTRLTTYAMTGATWATWLLMGLSEGGVAVALERAFYLIAGTTPVRKLRDDVARRIRRRGLAVHDVSTHHASATAVTPEHMSQPPAANVRSDRTLVRDLLGPQESFGLMFPPSTKAVQPEPSQATVPSAQGRAGVGRRRCTAVKRWRTGGGKEPVARPL